MLHQRGNNLKSFLNYFIHNLNKTTHSAERESDRRAAPVSKVEPLRFSVLEGQTASLRFQFSIYLLIFKKVTTVTKCEMLSPQC